MNKIPSLFWLLFLFILNSCNYAHSGENRKEMKASEVIKQINKGKPVQIYDKIIIGELDFTSIKDQYILSATTLQSPVKSNIFFFNCVFMGNVSATGTYTKDKATLKKNTLFEKNVTFSNCDFRQNVNFEEATVEGKMDFSQSVFGGKASFNGVKLVGYRNSLSGMTAEGEFTMISTIIYGNLNCMNATFNGITSFQELSVQILQFSNTTFREKVDFSNMTVFKNAYFNYVVFNEDATFSFSRYLGNLDFMYNVIEKNIYFSGSFLYGKIRLNQTDFRGEADFSETLFFYPPQQEGLKFNKSFQINIIENKPVIIN
jgi:uncharacterized protein YjbI with pentapeptide repeats